MTEPIKTFFALPWNFRTVALDIDEAKSMKRAMEVELKRLEKCIYDAEHEPKEAADESGANQD